MATNSSEPEFANMLATGEECVNRETVNSSAIPMTSGFLRLSYWTAQKDESAGNIVMYSGTVAAGATPTLIRIGIWTAGADGSLITLVASTTNDTTLLVAANTEYPKAVSSGAYTKVRGTRYATGLLVVTAATAPQVVGSTFGGQNGLMGYPPVRGASLSGQSDLPAGPVAAGSISAGLNRPWFLVKP